MSFNEGVIKWGTLAVSVIALECVGENSLTHYAHKSMEHPIGRYIVPAVIGITAMHLMDREHQILPESLDVFQIIAKGMDRLSHER